MVCAGYDKVGERRNEHDDIGNKHEYVSLLALLETEFHLWLVF